MVEERNSGEWGSERVTAARFLCLLRRTDLPAARPGTGRAVFLTSIVFLALLSPFFYLIAFPILPLLGTLAAFSTSRPPWLNSDALEALRVTPLTRDEVVALLIRQAAGRWVFMLVATSLLPLGLLALIVLITMEPGVMVVAALATCTMAACWTGSFAVALQRWLRWHDHPGRAAATTALEYLGWVGLSLLLVVLMTITAGGGKSHALFGFLLFACILFALPLTRLGWSIERAEATLFARSDLEGDSAP